MEKKNCRPLAVVLSFRLSPSIALPTPETFAGDIPVRLHQLRQRDCVSLFCHVPVVVPVHTLYNTLSCVQHDQVSSMSYTAWPYVFSGKFTIYVTDFFFIHIYEAKLGQVYITPTPSPSWTIMNGKCRAIPSTNSGLCNNVNLFPLSVSILRLFQRICIENLRISITFNRTTFFLFSCLILNYEMMSKKKKGFTTQ